MISYRYGLYQQIRIILMNRCTEEEESMFHGLIKVAAVTPKIKVADVLWNAAETIRGIKEAAEQGAKIVVLPELG